MSRRELIDVALGKTPADVLIRGGNLVNVATAEIYPAAIAIKGDRIAAVGDVGYTQGVDTRIIDAEGRFITPGLVDGHLHCYHSYLGVTEFVQAMLTHGVTATADGFYGQGIVGGMQAIRFFKDAFDAMPIRLIFLVPTLAYLQNRELGLTPAPGIRAEDMFEILDWDGCCGVEEPPFLPIGEKWDEFLDLYEATLARRKVITGHAAGLGDRELQAYVAMGTYTDHEAVARDEGLRNARAGMKLLMREASGAQDVTQLVRAYTECGIDTRTLGFCTDVASPEKLMHQGGIDENIRVAIRNGVPPIKAVQMGTINVAEIFYAQQDVGLIAPGRYADVLFVDNLVDFSVDTVLVGGEKVVEHGAFIARLPDVRYPKPFYGTVSFPHPVTPEDLKFRVHRPEGEVEVRVIGVTDGSLVTHERRTRLRVTDGVVQPDLPNDVIQIGMIDRLCKGTGVGLGFVQGFGLRRGAIASSVNAVCENVVTVGTNAEDMALAANHLAEIGGGKVVVADGNVVATVELPILGLLSEEPLNEVMDKFDKAFAAIAALGCSLRNPFSTLEFCFACGEIGEIKLSEEGLLLITPPHKVDVVVA
jgi:adenine deaminase